MKTGIISVLVRLVDTVLELVSPEIRDYLCKLIADLGKKAEATNNPFDDLLVDALKRIVGCSE